jgi:hypothetical protein
MEATDLRTQIADLEAQLEPPRGIPVDIWHAMNPDDQRRYLIKLVMELQADFVSCKLALSDRMRLIVIALVTSQAITVAIVAAALLGLR